MKKTWALVLLLCLTMALFCPIAARAAVNVPSYTLPLGADLASTYIRPDLPIRQFTFTLAETCWVDIEAVYPSSTVDMYLANINANQIEPEDEDAPYWALGQSFVCDLVDLWDDEESVNDLLCLNAGKYYLIAAPSGYDIFERKDTPVMTKSATIKLRAATSPLKANEISDPEGNNTIQSATPLTLGAKVNGMATECDYDFYSFTLAQTSKLSLALTQDKANVGLYLFREAPEAADASGNPGIVWVYERFMKYAKPKKTFSASMLVPSGKYFLLITQDMHMTSTPYSVKVTASSTSASFKLALPKTLKMAVGFPQTIMCATAPDYFPLPEVVYTSSKPSVASIDPQTGLVTPLMKGATTITAKTPDGKKKATSKLVIADNKFTRQKPLKDYLDEDDVCASTKSLEYAGNTMVADVFIYSNTKTPITGIGNVTAYLYDLEAYDEDYETAVPLAQVSAGTWTPKNGALKYKKYDILRVEFAGAQVMNLNLLSGKYGVIIKGDHHGLFSDYGVVHSLSKEGKRVYQDWSAQPNG